MTPASDTAVRESSTPVSLRRLTGTIVDGRYEVRGLLGCGGMGAVYEALQLQLDRRVAIKILNPMFMHRDDYVARFMQEAKTASRISHENVVQVLDFGKLPGGSVYSVMELLEGRDLAKLLRQETKLPWMRARDLLLQTIRGVRAAHAQGVIHRDIKPANLFLAREAEEGREVLKVLDFGIARLQGSASDGAVLTGTADLLGTPAYMAPELARGRRANPRTEVYSVGVVAYQMLTGQRPFSGDSAFDALFRAATEPTPTLRSHEASVPPLVEAVVLRMLAKDPDERFADMTALYRAVAGIDEYGHPIDAPVLITGPQITLDLGPVTPVPDPRDSVVSPLATSSVTLPRCDPSERVVARAPSRPTRRIVATAIAAAALAGVVVIATTSDAPDPTASVPETITGAVAPRRVSPPVESNVDILVVEEDEPTPPATTVPSARVASATVPSATMPAAPKRAAPKTTPRVEEPPRDADVLRRIQRRARDRCAELLGESLTITFGIGQRGEVLAPRGSHRGPATDCVIGILSSTRFATGSMRKEVLSL